MVHFFWSLLQGICLLPAIAGSIYLILCLLAVWRFRTQVVCSPAYSFPKWPGVTVLKPVRGLGPNLEHNLRSTLELSDFEC